MTALLLRAIHSYKQRISPSLPAGCRYLPTCSDYAYEAVERYGAARGSWLALRRLARCNPLHQGGLDPVPGSGVEGRAP
jgi:putative membrane protein insertion efficiency factor